MSDDSELREILRLQEEYRKESHSDRPPWLDISKWFVKLDGTADRMHEICTEMERQGRVNVKVYSTDLQCIVPADATAAREEAARFVDALNDRLQVFTALIARFKAIELQNSK